jgi:hypothetical protein
VALRLEKAAATPEQIAPAVSFILPAAASSASSGISTVRISSSVWSSPLAVSFIALFLSFDRS